LVATPGSSPFISDIFFLLQTYQHLGLNKTLDNRDRAEKNVKEFKKDLKRLEAEKAGWQAGVSKRSRFDSARKMADELILSSIDRPLKPCRVKPC
jgi:ubiquitin conjugation factor E4 B